MSNTTEDCIKFILRYPWQTFIAVVRSICYSCTIRDKEPGEWDGWKSNKTIILRMRLIPHIIVCIVSIPSYIWEGGLTKWWESTKARDGRKMGLTEPTESPFSPLALWIHKYFK